MYINSIIVLNTCVNFITPLSLSTDREMKTMLRVYSLAEPLKLKVILQLRLASTEMVCTCHQLKILDEGEKSCTDQTLKLSINLNIIEK
jgi:hypothetical protein